MGRIEQTLLGGERRTPTDLRPPPATRPYHRKVTSVAIRRQSVVKDAGRGCRCVPAPARKWWGGTARNRPCYPGPSYTPQTFSAERLFHGFPAKGLLVQDADFWCRRDFRCKAVQSGDSAQKVAGVYYDPALQVRPFRYKISAAPFTGRDGH